MTAQPAPGRPDMPGYGIPSTPPSLEWAWVEDQLEHARNFWICTGRPGGRAHAMPVWGLWLDGAVMFSTGRGSVKHRNIEREPRIVVHLESGDDVVIIEGAAREIADRELLTRFVSLYDAKYGVRPDPDDPGGLFYMVVPQKVLAWREQDFPETAARWSFDPA